MGGPAIDFRIVMGQVLGPVLVHNIDVGIDGDFFRNESKDLFRRSDFPGHDKMPDEEALLGNPVGIEGQIAHLAVHFRKDLFDHLGIVRSIAEFCRIFAIHKLHIRHIDVNDAMEQPNHLHRFVSGTVVDKRKSKPHFDRLGKGGNDLWNIMSGSDKIDVVTAHLLEPEHNPCHLGDRDGFASSEMGDIVILAEDAPKVAVSEEDGARAMMPYQGRLFPEMGKGAGDFQL